MFTVKQSFIQDRLDEAIDEYLKAKRAYGQLQFHFDRFARLTKGQKLQLFEARQVYKEAKREMRLVEKEARQESRRLER